MRFITEFKYDKKEEDTLAGTNYRKELREIEMGHMISESFGYSHPNNDKLHYRLEIEAFPTDKWVEFKYRLLAHIDFCNGEDRPVNEIRVLNLIKELESFGKPEDIKK